MTDNNDEAIDYDAVEAAEQQRVRDAIAAFRESLQSLKATEGAECNYLYEELLAAFCEGQLALADHLRGMSYFIVDMWPGKVGKAAEETAEKAEEAAFATASLTGLVGHVPQVPDPGHPTAPTAQHHVRG